MHGRERDRDQRRLIARYTVLSVSSEQDCSNYQLPRTPPASLADGGIAPEIPRSTRTRSLVHEPGEQRAARDRGVYAEPEDPNYANEYYSVALKAEWLGIRIQDAQNPPNLDNCSVCNKGDVCPACPIGAGMTNYPYASASDVPAPPPNGTPTTNFPYAWGQFESVYPDSNGICHIADMSSDMTYPDVPDHNSTFGCSTDPCTPYDVPDQPATHVQYNWTNLRSFVSPTAQGVQVYGNLSITQQTGTLPSCTITYSVSILTPRVTCGSTTDVDSNGNSLSGDQAQCDPNPDGPNNLYGSGISESVSPVCTNVSNDPANPDFECLPPTSDDDPNSMAL